MPSTNAGLAAVTLVLLAACGRAPDAPATIDLIAELATAERRAAGPVDEAVRAVDVSVEGGTEAAILLRAPARVTWALRVPDDAALTAAAAVLPGSGAGATLRVGISDDRYYEGLMTLPLDGRESDPVWQPVVIDLGKYAGWQWSLFYRPSERVWKLIVNADAVPGGTVALRRPVVTRSSRASPDR
jgi:hypothetical protein